MGRYAVMQPVLNEKELVDHYDVVNVIELDSEAVLDERTTTIPGIPPEGCILREDTDVVASPGDTHDGKEFTRPVPVPSEPVPDAGAALLGVFAALGKPEGRKLSALYPDFAIALQRGNWAVAREALDDALADGAVGKVQHDALMQVLDATNIPKE